MQDDKLQQLVTVQEAMTFVSNVKLDISVARSEKQSKVSIIMSHFFHRNNRIVFHAKN